jgi:SOS-response transcriptional repressor LexA
MPEGSGKITCGGSCIGVILGIPSVSKESEENKIMVSSALIAKGIDRRRAILRFCKAYIAKHEYGPSLLEITEAVGLSSKTAVRNHLDVMVREGSIKLDPGKYRSLRVVEKVKIPAQKKPTK